MLWYLVALGICLNFSAEWVMYHVPGILLLSRASASQKVLSAVVLLYVLLPFKESESIQIIRFSSTHALNSR